MLIVFFGYMHSHLHFFHCHIGHCNKGNFSTSNNLLTLQCCRSYSYLAFFCNCKNCTDLILNYYPFPVKIQCQQCKDKCAFYYFERFIICQIFKFNSLPLFFIFTYLLEIIPILINTYVYLNNRFYYLFEIFVLFLVNLCSSQ